MEVAAPVERLLSCEIALSWLGGDVRNRYYDPSIGRYISKDPLGFSSGTMNHYGYVRNNPVNKIDPLGLIEKENLRWHHLLPQELFDPKRNPGLFKNNPGLKGLDMNQGKYGWIADQDLHSAVHHPNGKHAALNPEGGLDGRSWNQDWKDWVSGEQKAGRQLTIDSVEKRLSVMKGDYSKLLEKGIMAEGQMAKGGKWAVNFDKWDRAKFVQQLDNAEIALGEAASKRLGAKAAALGGTAMEVGGKVAGKLALPLTLMLAASAAYSEEGGGYDKMKAAVDSAIPITMIESAVVSGANAVGHGIENTLGGPFQRQNQQIQDALRELDQ